MTSEIAYAVMAWLLGGVFAGGGAVMWVEAVKDAERRAADPFASKWSFPESEGVALWIVLGILAPITASGLVIALLWQIRRGPLAIWRAMQWLGSNTRSAYRRVWPAPAKLPEARTVQK